MGKFLNALAVATTIISFVSLKVFGGVHGHSSRYPTHIIDDELIRVVSKPNRWGYTLRWPPTM